MIRFGHCWRYDMGGFAWQNTELVPTYWLWLYFLRTGREDVFTVAEAMSRHCSEVDFYHFGRWQVSDHVIMCVTGAAPARNRAFPWQVITAFTII